MLTKKMLRNIAVAILISILSPIYIYILAYLQEKICWNWHISNIISSYEDNLEKSIVIKDDYSWNKKEYDSVWNIKVYHMNNFWD